VALLYDALGRELYEGGLTHDSIRDAIQAAARADDWKLAYEIAERYGWNNVCLHCAETAPTAQFWAQHGHWPICKTCKEILEPAASFSDVKIMLQGLIKRSVV
jgi:hypothetical protein